MALFTREEIDQARAAMGDRIRETPALEWCSEEKKRLFPDIGEIWVKQELFQYSGSFKIRGALSVMTNMSKEALSKGVTAISAGNHAIAVCHAAKNMGISAKVVMPKHAGKYKIGKCEELGAEVVLVDNGKEGFELVEKIEAEEGRTFIHPFEGEETSLGTATLGVEFIDQVGELDVMIIPVGGGGLASGMSNGIKLLNPKCKIYGVEPEGANTMYLSFQSGLVEQIDSPQSIATSLSPPFTSPFVFHQCLDNMEKIILVSDNDLRASMKIMMEDMKLAVEPAGAASLAGLFKMQDRFVGKKVGLIACGANISLEEYGALLS